MLPARPRFPFASILSTRPRCSNSPSVRAWTPTARDVVAGLGIFSMMRIGICSRDNSSAAVMPVGPAPTMRTFGGSEFMLISSAPTAVDASVMSAVRAMSPRYERAPGLR
jgi:hypothetical protein